MKFSISNHHLVIRLDNNLCTTAKDHTTRRRRLSKRVRLLLTAANQWLQIDVGPPTLITGVVTKGRGDGRRNQWVVRYRVSYSNDSHVWYFYKDSSHVEVKVRCKRKHLITTITTRQCSPPRPTSQPNVIRNSNPDSWLFRIRMSAGSLSKCYRFIILSASAISPRFVYKSADDYEKC